MNAWRLLCRVVGHRWRSVKIREAMFAHVCAICGLGGDQVAALSAPPEPPPPACPICSGEEPGMTLEELEAKYLPVTGLGAVVEKLPPDWDDNDECSWRTGDANGDWDDDALAPPATTETPEPVKAKDWRDITGATGRYG